MKVLTYTMLKAFRRCSRKFAYEYLAHIRLRRRSEPEARFGDIFYAGLRAWWHASYERQEHDAVLEAALSAAERMAGSGEDADWELARAKPLLTGYHLRWSQEALKPLMVRHEFRMPLFNPRTWERSKIWELGGLLDAVVKDTQTGDIWAVISKVSGEDISRGSPFWRRLAVDTRIALCLMAARSFGYQAVGVIYDVVGKPLLRPKLATPEDRLKYRVDGFLRANQRTEDERVEDFEKRVADVILKSPDDFFARGPMARTMSEVVSLLGDIWADAQWIEEAERSRLTPRNPDGCLVYRQMCPYFELCAGEERLEDGHRYERGDGHGQAGA